MRQQARFGGAINRRMKPAATAPAKPAAPAVAAPRTGVSRPGVAPVGMPAPTVDRRSQPAPTAGGGVTTNPVGPILKEVPGKVKLGMGTEAKRPSIRPSPTQRPSGSPWSPNRTSKRAGSSASLTGGQQTMLGAVQRRLAKKPRTQA